MFQGDTAQLWATLVRARKTARRLGHPTARAEHLLLALCDDIDLLSDLKGPVEAIITRPGVTPAAIEADRALLASVGVDLDELLAGAGVEALEPRSGRPPLLPLGGKKARHRWGPVGSDFRAAYEASLRLALARMERSHRPEHLLTALLAFDRGCAWLLEECGVDRRLLATSVHHRFPPPRRNAFLRAARSTTWKRRYRDITKRYENTSGGPAA
jgi:ATP-dependent Clp protease ATP-binding subunit ClpA